MTLSAGARIGPYEVLSPLGSGGMGQVYRARDTRLGREVALKVLPRERAGLSADALPRFAQEARSASALNHPGIVTVHELGEADGEVYIAMELVDGATLRETAGRGKLSVRKAVSIAADLAEALAAAHARGIVHRDLKPENVMVTRDGRAKIVDFGLAKAVLPAADPRDPTLRVDAGAPPTEPGTLLGSVGYMSP
ncbi:MAG TPA: serine/threonine-protein kinase, partial [Thermoanaerobaculia bacterium]|nr:serine/threonine-protein kinase [Thermoanaerobaculia bacterium]